MFLRDILDNLVEYFNDKSGNHPAIITAGGLLVERLGLDAEQTVIFNEIYRNWMTTAEVFRSGGTAAELRVRDLCLLIRPMIKEGSECLADIISFCRSHGVTLPEYNGQVDFAKRLAGVPNFRWKYTWDTARTAHVGPMAQTFHALFPATPSDRVIEPVDIIGQLLNLVQVHDQQMIVMQTEMRSLRSRIEELESKNKK